LKKIIGFVKVTKMKKFDSESTSIQAPVEWKEYIDHLDDRDKELFSKLFQIGQGEILLSLKYSEENAANLIRTLSEIEDFFASIGGILGYQEALKKIKSPEPFDKDILQAPAICLKNSVKDHKEAISAAIDHLPELAEVYAVGGAADRLNLKSGSSMLPAACLKINGKTLLESLIHDLEAKEWLYYKIHGKTVTVPCVMMTSFEKDNQAHIYNILKEHEFFQRPPESMMIFHQPLVPMVDEDLNWQTINNSSLFLKPGGHGAIWGLCLKEKIFDKLIQEGIKKLSIRQINNPIACIDFGHLAFLGYGFLKNRDFGFFACERFAGSQEGINVVLRDKKNQYALTNIEYCQLKSVGIDDVADENGLSHFPANTNVLFADLATLKHLTQRHCLPGQILNFKPFAWDGQLKPLARLETMMQNMADYLTESELNLRKTFMTLSPRLKTIAPVKKQKTTLSLWDETPQACFYQFMKNAEDLLDRCGIVHNNLESIDKFYQHPPFIFSYMPALGPIFDLICQKLQGGILHNGAYLELGLTELKMTSIDLKGALKITALNPYGYKSGKREFSEYCGRALIENCRFENTGIDLENSIHFYQDSPQFLEKCEVILEGFSEFHAKDVCFKGNYLFKVPNGYRLDVWTDEEGKVMTRASKLSEPSWTTRYQWIKDCLEMTEGNP
jgi:UTP---glucose-1-phosphate uridylyltransferase